MSIDTVELLTISHKIEEGLKKIDLPYKEINVIGTTICITTLGRDTADKWINIIHPRLAKFVKISEQYQHTKINKGTCLLPSVVKVYKTFFDLSKGNG